MQTSEYLTNFSAGIAPIPQDQWQALAQHCGPFLQYSFLNGLETCGCVGGTTGWQPHFITVHRHGTLVGAMPGYLKSDSYGEYVFDHSWANAYHHHGLNYYPKWISAVPFTPVTGPRMLIHPNADKQIIVEKLLEQAGRLEQFGASSCHLLFAQDFERHNACHAGYRARWSVQFQWHNYDYTDFDGFLSALTSRKRKDIRKSRQFLQASGICIERRGDGQIRPQDMAFFLSCYQQTYLKRSGHTGYLNQEFFEHLLKTLKNRLMLVIARQGDVPVASALFLYDDKGLYGRYWGSLRDVNGLHFECCYFQGIEFAIENRIPLFNPGTQGEHKILRGFEPIYCCSLHRLFASEFDAAVGEFLDREAPVITNYYHQAHNVLPFNATFRAQLISSPENKKGHF
ncbi:GNAT family N-acetyltransferase [Alteromonas aestuariivivens]|uniref:GNAT family N-acetyltransferase n=1 Tax=Alteromonas aestuariivivens TaxID=1938339 RepID=A0A3D8M5T4_9ALTE|nr:GNAT family N-acetyltransferase [Alteromonas aestuariivivens]RDV25107.1 GNAT family N-acetyltransferase [Alteromonas aestuariivivens]